MFSLSLEIVTFNKRVNRLQEFKPIRDASSHFLPVFLGTDIMCSPGKYPEIPPAARVPVSLKVLPVQGCGNNMVHFTRNEEQGLMGFPEIYGSVGLCTAAGNIPALRDHKFVKFTGSLFKSHGVAKCVMEPFYGWQAYRISPERINDR